MPYTIPRALSACLALTTFALSAGAEQRDESLYLSIHNEHAGAEAIMTADYEGGEATTLAAIRVFERSAAWPSTLLEVQNNLCVARIMLGYFEDARETCSRAVAAARRLTPQYRQTRRQLRSVKAVAFSNRGVLRILQRDPHNARRDLETALQLNPALDSAAQNLSLVNGEDRSPMSARVRIDTGGMD